MNEPTPLAMTYPRRALRAAIFLIAIECLMLALPTRNWLVIGGLFVGAASRWWTIRHGWCLRMPLLLNSVFLAAGFAIKYSFAPTTFPPMADFANTSLAHEIGCWLVSLQVLLLHESKSLKRIPVGFSALGCLAVLCAGDVKLNDASRSMMLALMLVFVGGLGWFAHAGRDWVKVDQRRRLRRGIMLVTLILAGVPTLYAARAWHAHERDLEMVLLRLINAFDTSQHPTRIRTQSVMIRVSNGKIIDPERPVLRVTQSSSEPLYFRGFALDFYGNNLNWISRESAKDLLPRELAADRGLPSGETLFPLVASDSRQWNIDRMTFLSKEDMIPLALLDTAEMKIGVGQLRIDSMRNLTLLNDPLPDSLVIYTPVEPEPDEVPAENARVRQIPEFLDPRILNMAQDICTGKTNDSDKIRAVESFFRENYQYQIGFESPNLVDPLTHFLLAKPRPAAHCEYFASGAAILLRAVGIPTRYVTGYVPSERHSDGDWIARRKDAHAWVEAYDSGLGRWVTVEATPSVGLPERRTASWKNELAESWRVWYQSFRETVATYGTWEAISAVLQSTIARGTLVLVLLAAWWGLSRSYRRQRAARIPFASTRVFPFQQWLREVESALAKRGFERLPHETLLHFRDRILASPDGPQLRPAAEWYAAYSAIRYNESEQTASRMSLLRQSWENLQTNSHLHDPWPRGRSSG